MKKKCQEMLNYAQKKTTRLRKNLQTQINREQVALHSRVVQVIEISLKNKQQMQKHQILQEHNQEHQEQHQVGQQVVVQDKVAQDKFKVKYEYETI